MIAQRLAGPPQRQLRPIPRSIKRRHFENRGHPTAVRRGDIFPSNHFPIRLIASSQTQTREDQNKEAHISGYPCLYTDSAGRDNCVDAPYSWVVSAVDEIIQAVKQLDEGKKGEFLEKLAQVNFDDAWDRRIDGLWREALTDIQSGRTKSLNEVLDDK